MAVERVPREVGELTALCCSVSCCHIPCLPGLTGWLPFAATALAYILAFAYDPCTHQSRPGSPTNPGSLLSQQQAVPRCPGALSPRRASHFLCSPSLDQGSPACPRASWQSPSPADFHSPAYHETSQSCAAPCPADPWGHSHFPRCSLLSIRLPHAEARPGLLLCQGVSSCSPLEKLGLGCCGFPALSQRALPGPRLHTAVLSEKQRAPEGWGALPLAGGEEADCPPQLHVA